MEKYYVMVNGQQDGPFTQEEIKSKGYSVVNVDFTIIAQAPKLAPYIDAMIENLSSDLESDVDVVNIKATTTENLGFEGRGEGIACHAVALIQ